MKKLKQYITEFVNINNISIYKYHPKTKKELIKAIETELKEGNTDLNCISTFKIDSLNGLFAQTSYMEHDAGITLTKKQQKKLDVSNWDVSHVKDMSHMFRGCSNLENIDLSNWNVSNVKDMSFMFSGCSEIKKLNTNNWNTERVENIRNMFGGCFKLENIINIENWNTKNVKFINNLFYNCEKLNIDITNWDMTAWEHAGRFKDDTFYGVSFKKPYWW